MRKPEVIEEGILPCPFCGNTKLKVDSKHNGHHSNVGTHSATVRCSKCHARGPTASCKVSDSRWSADEATKQKAIELWNNRIRDTELLHVGYSNGKLTALVDIQSKLKELAVEKDKDKFTLEDVTTLIAEFLK